MMRGVDKAMPVPSRLLMVVRCSLPGSGGTQRSAGGGGDLGALTGLGQRKTRMARNS